MSTTLLPPNATPQERELECVSARVSNVPVPLRDLWNSATCPSELLPWLAWTLSVDSWSPDWTDAQKRSVISGSVDVHRHKGTIGSIRRVLQPFGLSGSISEWWQQSPPGIPHTFTVTLAIINTPTAVQDSIAKAVLAVKPVRSALTLLTQLGFLGQINIVVVGRPAVFTRLEGAASV